MRFLVDAPLSPVTAGWLTAQGHDAVQVETAGLLRAADEAILQRAADEQRLVLTMDLDFPEIVAIQRLASPAVLLVRLSHATPERLHERLAALLRVADTEALAGAVTVLEDHRFRTRKLPLISEG